MVFAVWAITAFAGKYLRTSEDELRAYDSPPVTVSVGEVEECTYYERNGQRTTGIECPGTWVDHDGERHRGRLNTDSESAARQAAGDRVEAHVHGDDAWLGDGPGDDVRRSVRIGRVSALVAEGAAAVGILLLAVLVLAAFRQRHAGNAE